MAASRLDGTEPKSAFGSGEEYDDYLDGMLLQEVGEPWPSGCDPEQCPHVARLFDGIADDLLAKSDEGSRRVAMWNRRTFLNAAQMVRENSEALRKAVSKGKEA